MQELLYKALEGGHLDERANSGAGGENGQKVGNDLPSPYGVITCRFAANWQRMAAYGSGSPSARVLVRVLLPSPSLLLVL